MLAKTLVIARVVSDAGVGSAMCCISFSDAAVARNPRLDSKIGIERCFACPTPVEIRHLQNPLRHGGAQRCSAFVFSCETHTRLVLLCLPGRRSAFRWGVVGDRGGGGGGAEHRDQTCVSGCDVSKPLWPQKRWHPLPRGKQTVLHGHVFAFGAIGRGNVAMGGGMSDGTGSNRLFACCSFAVANRF